MNHRVFFGYSKKEQVDYIEKAFNEMTINTIQQIESQRTVDKEKDDGDTQEAIEDKISQDFDVNNNNCTNLNEDKTKNDYRFLSKFLIM